MSCLSCARGITDECNCAAEKASVSAKTLIEAFSPDKEENDEKKKIGRPQKVDEDITDPHSTGRKRAATLYPLNRTAFCEWRDLANCGGGKHPIVGCATGYQENLHHGPDKNTLNNTRDEDNPTNRNVHKICSMCHNRWHAANDKDYDPSIAHNPREANFAERLERLGRELTPKKN